MILTCEKLISAKPNALPIDNGAVVINRGTIQAVGPANKIINKFTGHRIYNFDDTVLMPGLINLHTHLELPPLLGIIKAKTFHKWVLNLVRAKKDLIKNDYKAASEKNIETLIKTGTTTVGEICTHGVSPALLKQGGLRAVVFRELITMSRHARNFSLTSFAKGGKKALIQNGLSPHTPYTVSENVLVRIRDITRPRGLKLAMHIAESEDEIRLLQRGKSGLEKLYQFADWDLAWAPRGRSSFEFLDRIGVLSPRLLAVHAVQVTDNDVELIKKSNVSVAHCPRSNKELGVGRMPLKKFLDAGITVGLGTDSLASVPTLNMWDEMRYAYRIHKRDGISAEDIFRLSTIGGARALGLDNEIGTIEPGKKADIIAVPLPKKNTGDLYSDLLRETKSCIMAVVNGKILYQEGAHRQT